MLPRLRPRLEFGDRKLFLVHDSFWAMAWWTKTLSWSEGNRWRSTKACFLSMTGAMRNEIWGIGSSKICYLISCCQNRGESAGRGTSLLYSIILHARKGAGGLKARFTITRQFWMVHRRLHERRKEPGSFQFDLVSQSLMYKEIAIFIFFRDDSTKDTIISELQPISPENY